MMAGAFVGGFVDFVGYPVGFPVGVRHGRGFQGAGKRRFSTAASLIQQMLNDRQAQVARMQAAREFQADLAFQQSVAYLHYQEQVEQYKAFSINTMLLAEM